MGEIKKFKRVLVANRGEIAIRVFRACRELGIRTVAIYSEEDKNTLFRTKADEAYQIGKGKTPVGAYLGIDEIIALAKSKGVDAIHPGYGFLAENVEFAKACADNGIEFIGPTAEMMDSLGDKIKSKLVAHSVGVPTIPGVEKAIQSEEEAVKLMEEVISLNPFCEKAYLLKGSYLLGKKEYDNAIKVYDDALEMLEKRDKGREEYYNYYTFGDWGKASNYDICVDSSILGIEGTAEFIIDFARKAGLL